MSNRSSVRGIRIAPGFGSIMIALIFSFSFGCRTAIAADTCSAERIGLYRAMIDTAIADTNVIQGWGHVQPVTNHYVYPQDRSTAGQGFELFALFNALYGVDYPPKDSLYQSKWKALREADLYRRDIRTPDPCLETLGGDSAAFTMIYVHNYNDSFCIVDVAENQNYYKRRAELEGEPYWVNMPFHHMMFLFVHDGVNILKVYREGPAWD